MLPFQIVPRPSARRPQSPALVRLTMLLVVAGVATGTACGPGPQEMKTAVQENRPDVVEKLLRENPALLEQPLHSRSQRGSTSVVLSRPLYTAAEAGHVDMARRLLEHDADVNGRGVRDQTALFVAAREGHLPVVTLLLDRGADVNAGGEGGAPLHGAAAGAHAEIMTLLLSRGARVDTLDGSGGTPLHAAMGIQEQDAEHVQVLVDHGAQVNARDKDGATPLHLAGNNPWSSSVLCARGADLEARNSAGQTPADVLRQSGDAKFLPWFLSAEGCRGLADTYRRDGVVSEEQRSFAVEVYKCAANYTGGCNNMGVAYMKGQGVPADPVRAANLYRQACDAGDMIGCSNLAGCYEAGSGVPPDADRARTLLVKACKGGYAKACR